MRQPTAGTLTANTSCHCSRLLLPTLPLQDPRSTFKALVDELDQVHQQEWFAQQAARHT